MRVTEVKAANGTWVLSGGEGSRLRGGVLEARPSSGIGDWSPMLAQFPTLEEARVIGVRENQVVRLVPYIDAEVWYWFGPDLGRWHIVQPMDGAQFQSLCDSWWMPRKDVGRSENLRGDVRPWCQACVQMDEARVIRGYRQSYDRPGHTPSPIGMQPRPKTIEIPMTREELDNELLRMRNSIESQKLTIEKQMREKKALSISLDEATSQVSLMRDRVVELEIEARSHARDAQRFRIRAEDAERKAKVRR